MARIRVELKAVMEYDLDPEDDTPTIDALLATIRGAQSDPMDYLDACAHVMKVTVTGEVVTA